MSIEITYFVHGTTTDNENGKATGWLPGELSELGKKQAKELAKIVKDKKFDVVFCSDLKRAMDSAELGFGNFDIIKDKRLRECNYGDWNGRKHDFKDDMKKYIINPFPNGESYMQVGSRMNNFINFLKRDYADKKVALVSHQAPQLAMEVIVNGNTWEQAIDNDWRNTGEWQPGWEYIIK